MLVDAIKRNLDVIKSWAIFAGTMAALLFVAQISDVFEPLTSLYAQVTGWALEALGHDARVQGTLVRSDLYDIEIILECTAVVPMVMFVAAVVAYPTGWRRKVAGVLAGLTAIALANLIRLVSLCYIGHHLPASFHVAHMLVWASLIVFIVVMVFLVWVSRCNRADAASQPA